MITKSTSGEGEAGTAALPPSPPPPVGLVVCGPCACGKSEVGSALAQHFKVPYVDADSYHSATNIQKMSNGIPLTDQDRFPWLVSVRKQMLLQKKAANEPSSDSPVAVVAACSALKKKYRKILRGVPLNDYKLEGGDDLPDNAGELFTIFVFLNCSEHVLQTRISARQGHFMKANMLSSQLASLEVPHGEVIQGHAVIVNGDEELPNVIQEAVGKLEVLFSSLGQN